jgi:hypothetical protein
MYVQMIFVLDKLAVFWVKHAIFGKIFEQNSFKNLTSVPEEHKQKIELTNQYLLKPV